jgi:hypothetical protein
VDMVAVAAAAMSTIAATTTTTKAVTTMLSTKSLLSSFSSCSCSCSFSGSSIPGLSSRCSRSASSAVVERNNNSSRRFLLLGFSSSGATTRGGRGALRLTVPSKNNGGGGGSPSVRNGSGVKKISAIAVGEKLPEAELSYLDKEENVQTVKISELARGKKLVLFAVPGAFTPTCSQKHLPGFVEKSGE